MSGLPPLVEPSRLLSYPGVDDVTMTEAETLVIGASEAVRAECGWRLDYEAVVDQRVGLVGSTFIFLPTLYLRDLSSVKVDGEERIDRFHWDLRGVVTQREPISWNMLGNIQILVSYEHGFALGSDPEGPYSPDDLPRSIETVVLSLAARATVNPTGALNSLKVGEVTESYQSSGSMVSFALSPAERAMLKQFRLP
jgi:hypothetical protein